MRNSPGVTHPIFDGVLPQLYPDRTQIRSMTEQTPARIRRAGSSKSPPASNMDSVVRRLTALIG